MEGGGWRGGREYSDLEFSDTQIGLNSHHFHAIVVVQLVELHSGCGVPYHIARDLSNLRRFVTDVIAVHRHTGLTCTPHTERRRKISH